APVPDGAGAASSCCRLNEPDVARRAPAAAAGAAGPLGPVMRMAKTSRGSVRPSARMGQDGVKARTSLPARGKPGPTAASPAGRLPGNFSFRINAISHPPGLAQGSHRGNRPIGENWMTRTFTLARVALAAAWVLASL